MVMGDRIETLRGQVAGVEREGIEGGLGWSRRGPGVGAGAMAISTVGRGTAPTGAPTGRITARDEELLSFVGKHGVVSIDQVRSHCMATAGAHVVARRLRVLEGLGLLRREHTWWKGPHVVMATWKGLRLAGLYYRPARLYLPLVRHALGVIDLAETLLARHLGAEWLTEREIGSEWARAERQLPRHLPDGLLVIGERRIAVELELSPKRPIDRYKTILFEYGRRLRLRDDLRIDGVWYFVQATPAGEKLRNTLEKMIGELGLSKWIEVHSWNG